MRLDETDLYKIVSEDYSLHIYKVLADLEPGGLIDHKRWSDPRHTFPGDTPSFLDKMHLAFEQSKSLAKQVSHHPPPECLRSVDLTSESLIFQCLGLHSVSLHSLFDQLLLLTNHLGHSRIEPEKVKHEAFEGRLSLVHHC